MDDQPTDQIKELQGEVDALKHEIVGMEHRLVQVVRNAYWALTQSKGWTSAKRLEAGAALIRYFLVGRATLVVSIGVGGLLALHASFMLAEQNRKIDLQNHLAVVSSEIAEAQRNSQFAQLIPPLVSDLNEARAFEATSAAKSKRENDTAAIAANSLYLRIAVLTQTFQPYRWIDKRVAADVLLRPEGSGIFFEAMQYLRRIFSSGFGIAPLEAGSTREARLELPLLTPERYSPERGLLLVNLFAARIDIRILTRFNVTFEKAYAPGARLDGIDVGGLVGPDLSKPLDFRGSNFEGATFTRASIGGALLYGSNLRKADISGADASEAKWDDVDLDSARLDYTNLQSASLARANLRSTSLKLANLSDADLESVTGLVADQLAEACISRHTTRLPPNSLPASYSVPRDCCRQWSKSVHGFMTTADGACNPMP